jgi:serine phosphatase RsbU (regulator of sigma subunit)
MQLFHVEMEVSLAGRTLEQTFNQNPLLPGVLLVRQGAFVGMLSRRQFFAEISRPFGRELILNRPLDVLCHLIQTQPVIFSADTLVFEAVQRCLQREFDLLYEPVVVELTHNDYRLLDVHDLLITQSRIYELALHMIQDQNEDLNRANAEITALNDRLKSENLRMSAELAIAKKLQKLVLPQDAELHAVEGLEISGFMEPADEIGGDYYDVLVGESGAKIGIGDVTGHGLASGVLMLMVQTAVRTLIELNITNSVTFFDVLNRTIYKNIQRMKACKDLTLALLDYRDGTICLSGQHEELIVVRSHGEIERVDTVDLGFPIGLDQDIAEFIAQQQIHLQSNDIVVLYTDGLTEANSIYGQQYGIEQLCAIVQQNRHLPTAAINQKVIDDLHRHIGTQRIRDDITLVVMKQK